MSCTEMDDLWGVDAWRYWTAFGGILLHRRLQALVDEKFWQLVQTFVPRVDMFYHHSRGGDHGMHLVKLALDQAESIQPQLELEMLGWLMELEAGEQLRLAAPLVSACRDFQGSKVDVTVLFHYRIVSHQSHVQLGHKSNYLRPRYYWDLTDSCPWLR